MTPISVIIPLYNGSAWIARTLDAVLAQTRRPTEILVIDDGSEDDGPAIVQRYSEVNFLRNPDKGANKARVFGLASSRCPYIALLDQDDRWTPGHLEKLGSILDGHADCPAAVGGHSTYVLGSEPVFPERVEREELFDQWAHFPFHQIPSPSGVLLRRDALEQAGGWPTHIEGVADKLTWFRVSARQPIRRTTACTWSRGEHDGSYSAKLRGPGKAKQYMSRNILAAEEALELRLEHTPDQQEELCVALEGFRTIQQVLEALEGDQTAAIRDAAVAFESAYAGKPEQVLWLACNGLAWMVSFSGKRPEDGKHTASYLLEHWPVSCTATGPLVLMRLEAMLGRSLLWTYYRSAPLNRNRFLFFTSTCRRRLIGKAARFFGTTKG